MRLRAAEVVPPTVLLAADAKILTPLQPLGSAAVPARLVPMVLPWTAFPTVPLSLIETPSWAFPAIRLPAPGVVPPTTL
jgi:hypothetical protein